MSKYMKGRKIGEGSFGKIFLYHKKSDDSQWVIKESENFKGKNDQ